MRVEVNGASIKVRRYCCWVKNPLSKEGISSKKEWVDASDVVDAALAYYKLTGAYPTDILSEDSADMEERRMGAAYGYFREQPDLLRQELAIAKRKLEATEERVASLQAQRDNFAHSYDELLKQHETVSNLLFDQISQLVDRGLDAMTEIAKIYPEMSVAEYRPHAGGVHDPYATSFYPDLSKSSLVELAKGETDDGRA